MTDEQFPRDQKLLYDEESSYDERELFDKKSPYNDKLPYLEAPGTMQSLPYPVILPQRRPNDKSRGFVRAYAPDLGKYKGIDETTFLSFLKEFHKSSQASGWFTVINVAAMGAGLAPSAIAMAVSMSVGAAATYGAEMHGRYRTNAYLDKANEEMFHPRNLHCMIMTFRPEASGSAVLNVGTDGGSSTGLATTALSHLKSNTSSTSNASNSSGGFSMGGGQKFRKSDGITEGEFAMPQAAQLVYPAPTPSETPSNTSTTDNNNSNGPKKESAWKSTGKFLADYKDRRAQAKFAATYGDDSKLAVPGASDPTRFASRFSDPNANPFDFISSGRDQLRIGRARGQLLRPDRGEYDDQSSRGSSQDGRSGGGGLKGGIKSMMQQDVLYLLIAEMPSEEEMRRLL